jgi:hypothetical protein
MPNETKTSLTLRLLWRTWARATPDDRARFLRELSTPIPTTEAGAIAGSRESLVARQRRTSGAVRLMQWGG